ncbi:hypothetical protein T492DRAFT_1132448 [Pavlovales sp. CCMP2436]|nr:hypothetical protein T492DRAFT_1132448 [Pavlovales sp. CCMP2436]
MTPSMQRDDALEPNAPPIRRALPLLPPPLSTTERNIRLLAAYLDIELGTAGARLLRRTEQLRESPTEHRVVARMRALGGRPGSISSAPVPEWRRTMNGDEPGAREERVPEPVRVAASASASSVTFAWGSRGSQPDAQTQVQAQVAEEAEEAAVVLEEEEGGMRLGAYLAEEPIEAPVQREVPRELTPEEEAVERKALRVEFDAVFQETKDSNTPLQTGILLLDMETNIIQCGGQH